MRCDSRRLPHGRPGAKPSETDTHPRSDLFINWLGITDPAEWKTVKTSVIAQRMAKLRIRYPAAPGPMLNRTARTAFNRHAHVMTPG